MKNNFNFFGEKIIFNFTKIKLKIYYTIFQTYLNIIKIIVSIYEIL